MVSFIPHVLIPALLALAFIPAGRRRILAWAPIAWAPDLDYVIQSQHRAMTHSAFVPIGLAIALLVLWRRRDPTARLAEFATRPGAPGHLLLASYYLASHLVMDVLQGGVVLWWPVADTSFYFAFEILLNTDTNTFGAASEGGTFSGVPTLSRQYPWLSTEHAAYLGFLALCGAAWAAARLQGGRAPRPVRIERRAVPPPAFPLAAPGAPGPLRASAKKGK